MIPTTPGLHEIATESAGVPLELSLSLPDPHDPHPPLVIALHYAGHEGQPHYATGYLTSVVLPGLRDLGAVLLAPDCPDTSWTTDRSERAILGLVDLAVAHWKIDPARVILTGYSMGAIGAWHITSRNPERFAVLLPIAGRPREIDAIRTPTYAIHGTDDALFPASEAEAAIRALTVRGIDAIYAPGPGLGHYETARYAPLLAASLPFLRAHLPRDPH